MAPPADPDTTGRRSASIPASAPSRRRSAWLVGVGLVVAGLLGAVFAVTVLLSGRHTAPTGHANEPVPAASSATATPPATLEPSAPAVVVHPAFSDAALRSARVPAYCDMPELTLVDGKVPEGAYGEAHGELVLEGPAAPVRVDLDGDGTDETVANYSCGASYVAAGAHWPDMLVVYGWDGTIRGRVSMGDHILMPTADTTSLTAMKATGNTVAVSWRDTNRVRSFTERNGTLAWDGKVTFDASPDLGATTVAEPAAFVTPSGNIVCELDDEGAGCQVFEHEWTAPPPTGTCEYLTYGDFVGISAGKSAEYTCTGTVWSQREMLTPVSYPEGRSNPEPSWFFPDVDSIVMEQGPIPTEAYALSYGRTLRRGPMECTVTQPGVSCTDTQSGHGFTVSKESVTLR